jgi:glyoxylase-like metal-dependent hydrolase (beta-lactamase superfamily II)
MNRLRFVPDRALVLSVIPALFLASAVLAGGATPASPVSEPPTGSASDSVAKIVSIGGPVAKTRVPPILAQHVFLPPQSISALDISGDESVIAVTTMAFLHDRNFWLVSADGKLLWGRRVHPWAPYQVATTAKGSACAVGLAYSRITPPHPIIALFHDEKNVETVLTDDEGDHGFLRYGRGDWRSGWLVSSMGDLVIRAGGSVLTIGTRDGAWQMTEDGVARKIPAGFPPQRPYRFAASADGRLLVLGYVLPEVSRLTKGNLTESFRLRVPPALLSVRRTNDFKELGSVKPLEEAPSIDKLHEPARDFPELGEKFRLGADAILPFRVAASVAVNADGSRIAFTEYAGWLWIRSGPAIGRWDPPYHVIPFVPRQRGWLRIVGATGEPLARSRLPREGLFDVLLDRGGKTAWCFPASWFARGMAGCTWRPADPEARIVFGYDLGRSRWTSAWEFPDAVSDLAIAPNGERVLASCWDGKLYLVDLSGKLLATLPTGSPARVRWSNSGHFAIAGTQAGEVVCLEADGRTRWRLELPKAELPPLQQPVQRVFEEVPVFQVGRVGPEHAYVGDTWLIKTREGGILVDTGGTSGIPLTIQRMKSAGVDLKDVRYLLHSHSHGDHCGAGYLWRTFGLKIVAPESADLTLAWLMPTLSDYGLWVPRPVDIPLSLKKAGDEADITLDNLAIKAIFVPGHSFDSVIYTMELAGQRVAFTGDIGFENQDILHRCWGDVDHARAVTEVIRTRLLPWKPHFVFRGHGARRDGTASLEDLVQRSQQSIRKAEQGGK